METGDEHKKRKCFKHSRNVPVAFFNETRYNKTPQNAKYANFKSKIYCIPLEIVTVYCIYTYILSETLGHSISIQPKVIYHVRISLTYFYRLKFN